MEIEKEFNEWWGKYNEIFLRDLILSEDQLKKVKEIAFAAFSSGDAKGSLRTMKAWRNSF